MIKCVVFDVDMTLVDADELHLKAFEEILKRRGYRKKIKFVYGWSNEELLEKNFPNMSSKEIKDVIKDKQKLVARRYYKIAKPSPYASYVLKKLKEKGKKICLLTQETPTELKALTKCLKFKAYDFIVDSSKVKHFKPHPEGLNLIKRKFKLKGEEVAFVGDSEHDLSAAKAARVMFILYTKYHRIKNWKKADYVINDLRKVLGVV